MLSNIIMRILKFLSSLNPFSRKKRSTRRHKKNKRHTRRRVMRGG